MSESEFFILRLASLTPFKESEPRSVTRARMRLEAAQIAREHLLHASLPPIFFADDDAVIAQAKALCGSCPVRNACLDGAISRQEPCGVWGGQLIEDGVIIERRRRAGRPPKVVAA